MGEEMISVIIPMYNAEKWIGRALDSLLEQTYKDFEVVVVDDGSTDRCREIVRKYMFKFKTLSICSDINSGVGHARNLGLELSLRDLIFFLDADDYLPPDALKILYEGWVLSKCPVVIGKVMKVSPDGESYEISNHLETGTLNKDQITKRILSYLNTHNDYIISHCWGRLYERSLMENYDIRFPENVMVGEDGAFNIDCLTYTDYVYIINSPVYYFQRHKDSSSVTAINSGLMDLSALRKSLEMYFSVMVASSIDGLERKTEDWGKRYE
jgi:glycosyltransferase EpsJ